MTLLNELKFLIIDCQTTGATPDHGDILEIAWTCASLKKDAELEIESRIVRPDDFTSIPNRIRQLTGIKNEDVFLLW